MKTLQFAQKTVYGPIGVFSLILALTATPFAQASNTETGLFSDCFHLSSFDLPENFGTLAANDLSACPQKTTGSATLTAGSLDFSQELILRGALGMDSCRAFQIWGNYYTGTGEISPANQTFEMDNELNGVIVGLSIGFGKAFTLSGYYNRNNASVDYNQRENQTTTNLGGLALRYNTSGFYFSLLGNYGDDSSELKRDDGLGSLDYDGWQATGFFETGFNWPTPGRLFVLTPFSNFQYSTVKYDSFNRSALTLTGETTGLDAFYQTLGSRIGLNLPGLNMFDIQGRMAWIHQYLNEVPMSNYQIGRVAGTITPTTVFYDGQAGRDWFWGGAGLKISLGSMFSAAIDYDVLVNGYQTTHIGSVGLLVGF